MGVTSGMSGTIVSGGDVIGGDVIGGDVIGGDRGRWLLLPNDGGKHLGQLLLSAGSGGRREGEKELLSSAIQRIAAADDRRSDTVDQFRVVPLPSAIQTARAVVVS